MSGPAGVMALVLAETAAGGIAFVFLTPLWTEVRRGFFYLTGAVILVLALAAAGSAAAGYDPAVSGEAGRLAAIAAAVLAGTTLLWLVLLAVPRTRGASRVAGVATVPIAVVMLWAFARTTEEATGASLFQLLAGAAFTGAVLDGLLLGHWYLTDRKLTRRPINRAAWLLIGAVALEVAGVIIGFGSAHTATAASNSLSPLLTIAGLASWIALGMVLCTGLIAVFIRLTLKGARPAAVQSATGFFYLAVITAFTAELAAKVRFLP